MAGICKGCGITVWDRKTPRAERPGYRAQVLLANASTMDVTVCEACGDALYNEENEVFERLWPNVLRGWQASNMKAADLAKQARDNFVVGFVSRVRWKDAPGALRIKDGVVA